VPPQGGGPGPFFGGFFFFSFFFKTPPYPGPPQNNPPRGAGVGIIKRGGSFFKAGFSRNLFKGKKPSVGFFLSEKKNPGFFREVGGTPPGWLFFSGTFFLWAGGGSPGPPGRPIKPPRAVKGLFPPQWGKKRGRFFFFFGFLPPSRWFSIFWVFFFFPWVFRPALQWWSLTPRGGHLVKGGVGVPNGFGFGLVPIVRVGQGIFWGWGNLFFERFFGLFARGGFPSRKNFFFFSQSLSLFWAVTPNR